MSQTPVPHPAGWEGSLGKLADRASLPPVPGEERGRPPGSPQHNLNYHGPPPPPPPRRASAPQNPAPSSPLAYMRWANSFQDLLEDPEGVRLFQMFVQEAGVQHSERLNFFFACQGLKRQWDPQQPKVIVQAIYNFLRKSQLTIPDDVKRRIKRGLKDEEELSIDIFDSMQSEVEALIKETTYPAFFKSDLYLQVARGSAPQSSSGSLSSSSSSKDLYQARKSPLATLHEDEELNLPQNLASLQQHGGSSSSSTMPPPPLLSRSLPPQRLTKELLMATQNRRLQPEALHGGVFGKNYSVYSQPHLSYSAYCPASRQDSELQSMSSGRADSDILSMSGSSIDGVSACRGSHGARRQHARHVRSMMESALVNRDIKTHGTFIPRTSRLQKGQCQAMKPETFASILIGKLEKVKKDQESQEKLDRKLKETDVAAALREKFQLDDDNDQDILDQHVSRVWSDLTPARSPGIPPTPPPYSRKIKELHSRDVHSTLSADSGNVRDFGETSSGASVTKSRSVPDYRDPIYLEDRRFDRSASRKTLTELTDSGVSVVSDTPPVIPSHQAHSRVLMWIQKGSNTPDRHGHRSFSRSGSAERPSDVPPMATMSQLPPHTAMQLEEARHRLEHQHLMPRHSKRMSVPVGKAPAPPPPQEPPTSTVVVFTFLEEQVPYRTKIPARPVTLKQFKEYLPKKGNYRYFFKTLCEEMENAVIQEEIVNDSDILPLFEDKIMARVKNVE